MAIYEIANQDIVMSIKFDSWKYYKNEDLICLYKDTIEVGQLSDVDSFFLSEFRHDYIRGEI